MRADTRGLSANALKLIAVCAMLIDHIAWAFVPFASPEGQIMHIIGRLTAPIMSFFIAEGYFRTRSIQKYALRLGIFAVASHFPYVFFHFGDPFYLYPITSVIYTLFLALMALIISDKVQNVLLKALLILLLCVAAMPGDWMFMPIIWALIFAKYRGDFKKQCIGFTIAAAFLTAYFSWNALQSGNPWYSKMFVAGVLLVLPLLALYNGQRGKGGKPMKWMFYVFYPLHLAILGILQYYVLK